MVGFLFGQGTDTPTAQELALKRARIEAMSQQAGTATPANVGEGIAAIGKALFARIGDRRLDPKEDAERSRYTDELTRLLTGGLPMGGGMPSGGGMAAPAAPLPGAPVPPVSTGPIPAPVSGPAGMPMGNPSAPLPPQIGAAVDRVAPLTGGAGVPAMAGNPGADMLQPAVPVTADLLRQFEGFRETPYWDVNAHRAGYGSDTITAPDGSVMPVTPGSRVSQDDAERDLERRITSEFMPRVVEAVGPDAFAQLNPNQQAALTSIAYNYGRLPESVARAVQSGDPQATAQAIAALGSHNNGINADRRRQEAEIFAGGDIPMTGTVSTMGSDTLRGDAGSDTLGTSAPNMQIIAQLAEMAGNPYATDGQRMIVQMLMQQQMGQLMPEQMSPLEQIQLEQAQIELDQMRNPTPETLSPLEQIELDQARLNLEQDMNPTPDQPSSVQEYLFYADQETAQGREPLPYSEWSVIDEQAANPAIAERQQGARDTASDTIITAADRALEASQDRMLPSMFSGVSSLIPSSPSREIYRQVETLRSVAAIENINAMRQQSPTGAALGAASDKDIDLLKSKSGALDPTSPNFERDLADYTLTLLRTVHGYDEGERIFRERYQGAQPDGGAGETVSINGYTIQRVQ